jgi:peptide-methionine (R)-S-oxide reductase
MQEKTMFESNEIQQADQKKTTRRVFLGATAMTAAALYFRMRYTDSVRAAAYAAMPKQVRIVEFTNAGQRGQTVTVNTVTKTDAEWKAQLSPESYDITRREGTERPFTHGFEQIHGGGVFACICCDTVVFNANTKFDSGTGWPSFWQPIAKENVIETTDSSLGMVRTAVSCRRCEAHLGHVFDDGPRPTGLRYCMNGVALKFDKA